MVTGKTRTYGKYQWNLIQAQSLHVQRATLKLTAEDGIVYQV